MQLLKHCILLVLYEQKHLSMITHPYFMHEIVILHTPFCEANYGIYNKIYVHLLLSVLAQEIHSQLTRMFGRL
jgi:hypothetical protein